jgi:hypothetical protein
MQFTEHLSRFPLNCSASATTSIAETIFTAMNNSIEVARGGRGQRLPWKKTTATNHAHWGTCAGRKSTPDDDEDGLKFSKIPSAFETSFKGLAILDEV